MLISHKLYASLFKRYTSPFLFIIFKDIFIVYKLVIMSLHINKDVLNLYSNKMSGFLYFVMFFFEN